jgi:thiol-disulfide isomerase/thioredoxin
MNHSVLLLIVLFALCPLSTAQARLKIGDQAPELSITDWIQGEPVELSKMRDKKVVVVEFWATWCAPCVRSIPHLSDLQKKYADEVVVVGVTKKDQRNSLTRVQNFVNDRKDQMNYTVAFDGNGSTFRNYMTAMGQSGIPTSFIVDKSGKVVWVGHPARIDQALRTVIGGDFDSDIENIRNLLKKRTQKTRTAGEFDDELRAITALLALSANELSSEDKAHLLRKFRLENQLQRWDAAVGTAKTIVAVGQENAAMLNNVAWELLTQSGHKGKNRDLALKAAVRSNELTKNGRWAYLDTLALAQFENNAKKEAAEIQRRALELARVAKADAKLLAAFEKRLKEFEAAASAVTPKAAGE